MIIHDIVNGKHTHCRKCIENTSRADEVKRSTKILKQKCFLLFPTEGLPNPISLQGSANTADTVSQLAYAKKKKGIGDKAAEDFNSVFEKLPQDAFDLLISYVSVKSDKTVNWNSMYNFLVDLHEGRQPRYNAGEEEAWGTLMSVLDRETCEQLLGCMERLDYAQTFISVNELLGISSLNRGVAVRNRSAFIGAKDKINSIGNSNALIDTLGNDMATLREPQLGHDNRLSVISAFSSNDKRYPDGSDPAEVAAFQDRRYRIVCALPGSVILMRELGLMKIADALITVEELPSGMVNRITELVDRWSAQEYQCNNCTEDGHSIAYVIQAVDHKNPDNNAIDPITTQNDLFIIGSECVISLVNNPDHFVGFEGDAKGDIVFSSKQALDSVSQAMQVFHVAFTAIRSSIEADKQRGIGDAPKSVACVIDNGDSIEVRFCGRPMMAKLDDKGQPMQKVDETDYHPVRYDVPVGGHSGSFVRMCRKMLMSLASQSPDYFMFAESLEDFNAILVTNVKTRVTSGFGVDLNDPVIEKEAKQFSGFSKNATQAVLSIMHEVFDTSMYYAGYKREPPVTTATIMQRDINQTLARTNKSSGFTIIFGSAGSKSSVITMTIRTPSEKTVQTWKEALLVMDAKFDMKTEEGEDAVGLAKDVPIHLSWFRPNAKGKQSSEVVAVDGNSILGYVQNNNFDELNLTEADGQAKTEAQRLVSELYKSLDVTEYSIDITDATSVESALASVRSAITMWDGFITDAMAVSYENLTMLADKIKLSTKGVFRRFKAFGFNMFLQAPNENEKISDYIDFRSSSDPSVRAQLLDRFNKTLTDTGNISSKPGMKLGDADEIIFSELQERLGADVVSRVFALNGKPCDTKSKFAAFFKAYGRPMSEFDARDMLSKDADTHSNSIDFNDLPEDEKSAIARMIANAYHTVAENKKYVKFVTVDKSYV